MFRTGIRYLYLTGLLFLLNFCVEGDQQSREKAEINGIMSAHPLAMLTLSEIGVEGRIAKDSVLSNEEGGFYFKFPVSETGFFLLTTVKDDPLVLLVEGGDKIELECNSEDIQMVCGIEGSPGSVLIRDYYRYTGINRARVDSIREVFNASKELENFAELKPGLDSSYMGILQDQRNFTRQLIRANISSLVSVFLVNQRFGPNSLFTFDDDLSLFRDIDSALSIHYPGNAHVVDQYERLNEYLGYKEEMDMAEERLSPGNPAPVFSLPNMDGKPVSLDSLKGKFVLLYFWAAYDAPSRKYNRKLMSVIDKYENLQVMAVSMDDRMPVWEGAVHLDKLDVINVSDLKGKNSPIVKLYNLGDSLPEIFLLDEDGRILARPGKTDDLEKMLNEYINP